MEFEEQLASERECFEEENNRESESVTSEQDKTSLPGIDLFLNPSRMAEKEEMLKEAHREEAGTGHNKVREN